MLNLYLNLLDTLVLYNTRRKSLFKKIYNSIYLFYLFFNPIVSMDILKKCRRQIASFSLAMLIASTFAVGLAQAGTFDDVQPDDWFYAPVEALAADGVLNTSFSAYRPGDNANRAEAAKLLVEAFDMELVDPAEPTFDDVAVDAWYYTYVETAAANGVVSGYADQPGIFGPGNDVNRAEFSKMAVNSAPLAEDATFDPDFPDVEAGDWFYTDVVTAYNWMVVGGYPDGTFKPGNSINRAEIAKMTFYAMNPEKRTEEEQPPVDAGGLSVSLDGTSPASTSIPRNGANVLYSIFKLKAAADEDVRIDELIVTREGLGLPGDFDNVKIYVDGVQVGSEKTINTSTNSATFALAGDPIIVPAGSSVLVEVRGDMAGQENSYNSLCISAADSILAYGESSGAELVPTGSFAICGEEMNTTSADVGSLEYEIDDYTGDINIGETDIAVARVALDVDNTEDADITRVTLKQRGSADPEDLANPTLYLSGSPVDVESSWNGDFLTFDLSGNPIFIERGNSRTLEVRLDVVGGLGDTIQLDVYRDWHVEATGRTYGFGLNVDEVGAPPVLAPRDIIGGNLALSTSANNPTTGDVMAGGEDIEFLAFNMSTGGDGVEITDLQLDINYVCTVCPIQNQDLQDVKIWTQNSSGDWVVIAGPLDPAAGAVDPVNLAFTDNFTQNAGETKEYVVTADVENTADNLDTFDIDLDVANIVAEYLSNGDEVLAGDITGGTLDGKVMTVADPTLEVSLSAVPTDQNIVGGQNDIEVAGWNLQASSASDIKVTSLTISCTYTNGDPDGGGPLVADTDECADVLSNAELYQKAGSTYTLLEGGESIGGGAPTGEAVFNNLSLMIPSGEAVNTVLRVNSSSAADNTDTAAFEILAVGDIIAEDIEFNTLAAGQKSTIGGPTTITFVGSGTLTVGLSGNTPEADALVGGAEGQFVTQIKFEADENEDITIEKLRLFNQGGFDDPVSQVMLYDGGDLLATSILSAGDVEFTGLNIVVPADGQKVVDVHVDTNTIGSGAAITGQDFSLTIDDVDDTQTFESENNDVKATGNSSGELVNLFDAGNLANASNFIAYNTVPVLTRADSSPTSGGGTNVNMLTIDVSAVGEPGEAGILEGITIAYAGTCAGPATFTPYKDGNPIGIPVDLILAAGEFNNTIGLEVATGTTETIEIHVDNSGCGVDETLAAEVTAFDWNDGDATYNPAAAGNFLNFDLTPNPVAGHLFKL